MPHCEDYFGFLDLDINRPIKFSLGTIQPVDSYDDIKKQLFAVANPDGFLYPPRERRVEQDPVTGKELRVIPGSERPAHLRNPPVSHVLRLSLRGPAERYRQGLSAFIIHLVASLYGFRAQFHDWWIDGRIPVRNLSDISPDPVAAGEFLSDAIIEYRALRPRHQRLLTNLLYMHGRSSFYEWPWEHFLIQYMVTDALYRLVEDIKGIKARRHADRIHAMCRAMKVRYDEPRVTAIVKVRNGLQHEALWAGRTPGTYAGESVELLGDHLRRLNRRLIAAYLGKRRPYLKTSWWSFTNRPF